MKRLLLLAVLCTAAHAQSDWTREDTAREIAFLVVNTADYSQTLDIAKTPNCYEQNPIMGRHPSRASITRNYLISNALNIIVARLLPGAWRHAFQYITIGWEAGLVEHNARLGIHFSF